MAVEIGRESRSHQLVSGSGGRAHRHDAQRTAGRFIPLDHGAGGAAMRAGTLVTILLTVVAATLLFYAVVHEVSGVWLDLMLRRDVHEVVEHSLADQKAL